MKNANIRYFNVHTEGFGYLNGLKEVTPKQGQTFKPFWVSSFCMQEGDPQSPRKTYISVQIANPNLVELLQRYTKDLNSGTTKVFVNARLAGISATPFIYGDNSSKAGELGVNWEGKIINLLYLKVGDTVVELKKETTTDYGLPANRNTNTAPAPKPVIQAESEQATGELFDKPLQVRLDKSDPHFDVTKDRLKDEGYRWNNAQQCWMLSNVSLSKDDAQFTQKCGTLKSLGYRFDGKALVWNIPSAPKQQGNQPYRSSNQHYNRVNA